MYFDAAVVFVTNSLLFRFAMGILWSNQVAMGQSNQECKETSRIKCMSHLKKLELRFLHITGLVTHLFLGFAIVQNRF
jgi:hypothetical protein